jgi:hypothetical protein
MHIFIANPIFSVYFFGCLLIWGFWLQLFVLGFSYLLMDVYGFQLSFCNILMRWDFAVVPLVPIAAICLPVVPLVVMMSLVGWVG